MSQILLNKVSLLLKCVEFYANEDNYNKKLKDNNSQIDLDGGFVAKETIKTLNTLSQTETDLNDLTIALENEDGSPEEIYAKLKEITDKFKQS